MRSFTLVSLLLAAACGRSHTGPGGDDAGPRTVDAAAVDAAAVDAAAVDAGPVDAGPVDAGPEGGTQDAGPPPPPCVPGSVRTVVETEAAPRHLAIAANGDDALAAFTIGDGPASRVVAIPMSADGTPRGEHELGEGSGATLVPYTLGREEPGFTLVYRSAVGTAVGARFDVRAETVGVGDTGAPNDAVRPVLVIGESLVMNLWESDGWAGFVQDVPDGPQVDLRVAGDDLVGAVAGALIRVASHDGASVLVGRYDASGRVDEARRPSDFAVRGVEIFDADRRALVHWGTREVELARGDEAVRFEADGEVEALDADYDPRSGWTVLVVGVRAGDARDLVWLASHSSGARDVQILARDVSVDELSPRITSVRGSGVGTFLIAWPEHASGAGAIRALTASCDAP